MHKNNLFSIIDAYSIKHNLFTHGSRVILGLSGGPDSMFLLDYLAHKHKEGFLHLVAAHLDHEWRQNSHEDLIFCAHQSARYTIPFVGTTASQLKAPIRRTGSLEDKGRQLRRYFFEQICTQENASAIALAHQQDDQQETFFIRLIRGSSLAGIIGMKPKQGLYIRPLLTIRRTAIMDYLHTNNIPYCTDPSNSSPHYLRNRIRHTVIPALHATDARIDKNFAGTLAQLQETDDYITQQATKLFFSIQARDGDTMYIRLIPFNSAHPCLQKRVLVIWFCHEHVLFTPTEKFFQEIMRFFVRPSSATHQLHSSWSIKKSHGKAYIIHHQDK